jgi:hypothetical protein
LQILFENVPAKYLYAVYLYQHAVWIGIYQKIHWFQGIGIVGAAPKDFIKL